MFLSLSLLMLGVFADDHDFALALDDFALFAHGLYGRSDFHFCLLARFTKFLYCLAFASHDHLDLHVMRPRVRS